MKNVMRLCAVAFAAGTMMAPQAADSQPNWPILIGPGQSGLECWLDYAGYGPSCFYSEWTIQSDFSFGDTYGGVGTASWNPNIQALGSQGALTLDYDPNSWPWQYRGLRTNGTTMGGSGLSQMNDVGGGAPNVGDYWEGQVQL